MLVRLPRPLANSQLTAALHNDNDFVEGSRGGDDEIWAGRLLGAASDVWQRACTRSG